MAGRQFPGRSPLSKDERAQITAAEETYWRTQDTAKVAAKLKEITNKRIRLSPEQMRLGNLLYSILDERGTD